MAFPTDFATMQDYVSFLMQDTSTISPALTNEQKGDLINSALKSWSSEISPRIETVAGLSLGLSFSAGIGRSVMNTNTVAEVLACYSASSALADIGTPMEQIELHEMIALQMSDTTQSATATKWSIQMPSTTVASSVGLPLLWIHPLSDGASYVALAIRRVPATLSGSQVPNISAEEVDYVCRMAAWEGARLAGRSDSFRDGIIAGLPEKAAVYMRKYKGLTRPTKRPAEEPV